MISELTDAQFNSLKKQLYDVGREKLIDRLEIKLINSNMQGKTKAAKRYEISLEWVRKQNDWFTG
jgi:hypothetical protein